ncbi:MAG TPA: GNAT family N-acetyltransferase [Acidobacteriota bacterium]|nr:GNAT family N-acetyltransferase [Acidobacteriota bacterium]
MLTTERLRLRSWQIRDATRLRAITNNPCVVRHVGGGEFWTEARVDEFIERQQRTRRELGYCLWAAELIGEIEPAGYVGLQPLGDSGEVEIGWLLDEPYWGRGLATEAAACAMNHGFEQIGVERLVAIAVPDNHASINVMRKLGMSYERHLQWKGFEVVLHASFNPATRAKPASGTQSPE